MDSLPQELDSVFAALAHAKRRAILARLTRGETTVNELVAATALSQPAVSKHLKVLERAGLISRSRTANFRPVLLNAAPLAAAWQWIGHRTLVRAPGAFGAPGA